MAIYVSIGARSHFFATYTSRMRDEQLDARLYRAKRVLMDARIAVVREVHHRHYPPYHIERIS